MKTLFTSSGKVRRLKARLLTGNAPAWLTRRRNRAYIERVVMATPPWVNHKEMLQLHRQKALLTELTGVQHSLDHIVPLKHPMVCGLNVPWNLQIMTEAQNSAKSNNWCPDQMEMFP